MKCSAVLMEFDVSGLDASCAGGKDVLTGPVAAGAELVDAIDTTLTLRSGNVYVRRSLLLPPPPLLLLGS